MTVNDLVSRVLAKPEIKLLMQPPSAGGINITATTLDTDLRNYVPSVINEVALSHEWDFLIQETSTTSVADQATYTLSGLTNNCLRVATVKYGDDEDLLTYITQPALDDKLTRTTITTVTYWVPYGRKGGSPVIKIVDTPEDSGETILYRYWRSNVGIGEFSAVFDYLLEVALTKRLVTGYSALFDKVLAMTINDYERSGGGTDITVLDERIIDENVARANLHGWPTA